MQIILKTRFQFPHWVMKNVLFPKVITIFKLYLFWFKMEQTLPGFDVDSRHAGFRFGMFPQPVWLRRSLHSKTLSTPHNWKTNRTRPARGETPKFTKKKG